MYLQMRRKRTESFELDIRNLPNELNNDFLRACYVNYGFKRCNQQVKVDILLFGMWNANLGKST